MLRSTHNLPSQHETVSVSPIHAHPYREREVGLFGHPVEVLVQAIEEERQHLLRVLLGVPSKLRGKLRDRALEAHGGDGAAAAKPQVLFPPARGGATDKPKQEQKNTEGTTERFVRRFRGDRQGSFAAEVGASVSLLFPIDAEDAVATVVSSRGVLSRTSIPTKETQQSWKLRRVSWRRTEGVKSRKRTKRRTATVARHAKQNANTLRDNVNCFPFPGGA